MVEKPDSGADVNHLLDSRCVVQRNRAGDGRLCCLAGDGGGTDRLGVEGRGGGCGGDLSGFWKRHLKEVDWGRGW